MGQVHWFQYQDKSVLSHAEDVRLNLQIASLSLIMMISGTGFFKLLDDFNFYAAVPRPRTG